MKKLVLIFLLIGTVLYGCSDNSSPASSGEKEVKAASGYDSDYAPNPQVPDDRTLLKKADSHLDEKGEVTLINGSFPGDVHELGPIKLTVHDTKLIHLVPDYSLIDYFHVLTHEEEFDFLKLFVEIENASDSSVNFAPIALLETNTGEKIDWEKDIYLEELNGELKGGDKKKGNLGFILEDAENLDWIEITTSDVFDEKANKIQESKKIRIEL
ncbi:hypothetical protein ACOJQI_18365 [Bacillus salacetis]|uniref:hypothetical protein n=1 Tax=Bacillus salacetis TaxID=2315464 RepID=UPI003B9F4963